MITPREDLEPRGERPHLIIPKWQRFFGPIIGRVFQARLKASFEARNQRVRSLMNEVHDCETREALESLLGPPKYAMSPQNYKWYPPGASEPIVPDQVEVYQKNGCQIELEFKDGRILFVLGSVTCSSWDIVTGVYKSTVGITESRRPL